MELSAKSHRWQLLLHDTLLISIMMVLAACGLIYEYLLSHYAGRVLGIMETAIYAMIGIMIVAMGLGALSAKFFKNSFTVFAWLEAIIALIGMSATLVIAALIALSGLLPQLLSETFNLPPDTVLQGGVVEQLQSYSRHLPYVAGFILGFLIGMEIPLIARVRETVYGRHLSNNIGTIYGADYIGAGIGAVIWVSFMLTIDITLAAVLTAAFNLLAGLIFLWRYWGEIKFPKSLAAFHLSLILVIVLVADSGARWMSHFANVLYSDQVFYQVNTPYQNITFTRRSYGGQKNAVIDMYLNGRLQFSSSDENIYHSMLTYPALLASARQENVLIIGGGDGLALRDVLKWKPEKVTLIDLDQGLVSLFSHKYAIDDNASANSLRTRLIELNKQAFERPEVEVLFGDAFIEIEKLLEQQLTYDTILVDLPDPSHPDLNKLYSDYFYARLKVLLNGDGAIAVQSTSPYHAKDAFISIGKTIQQAGFLNVEQYRQNVPSFGEWGWTIATKSGQFASSRIKSLEKLPIDNSYITLPLLTGSFAMPANYYEGKNEIKINHLGSGVLYQYHTRAWQQEVGVYSPSRN